MSDFHLKAKSTIKDRQLMYLTQFQSRFLPQAPEEKDLIGLSKDVEELYRASLGQPLFRARRAERNQLPYREEMQYNMEEVVEDINILSDEQHSSAEFLKDAFNAVQSEKKRLTSRLDGLNSLVGDLLLLSGEKQDSIIYLKESFNRTDSLDSHFVIDSVSTGDIHTQEGILTLGRSGAKNLSLNARVAHVSGNGESGTAHIVRRTTEVSRAGEEVDAYRFINERDADLHTEKENILDDRPDTLFQYQRVNVPEDFKRDRRHFDFAWANSQKESDPLRLKLIVELDEEETLNWVTLHPYYANNDSGKIIVRSIQTSTNGFDYQPLYSGVAELNQTINSTPQTYRLDDVFTGENNPAGGQYSGKGVWSFPQRRARFVEFVIDQPQSYEELIGHAVYTMRTENQNYAVQVPEPEELKNATPGEYIRTIDGERVIFKKEIQATPLGWRYSIGLRDIALMQQLYDSQSYFVSERYELPRTITKVSLYAKEIIPKEYLTIIERNNDWVVYEVSFDDSEWIRISPMHQEPLNDAFPPKIIELNKQSVDVTNAFAVHKALIKTDDNPKQMRLRITLKRPIEDGFEHTTPIVEEVALKVEMEGEI